MTNVRRKIIKERQQEASDRLQSEKNYIEKLLDKIELKAEDYTDTEEGHWCLESFGDIPFDNYSRDEEDRHILERFRRKYKLPFMWLSTLTRKGMLNRYCIDDGTLHLFFTSKCRLGGVTE